jgi:hypothetical protein
VEPALGGANVEIADRIGFELPLSALRCSHT